MQVRKGYILAGSKVLCAHLGGVLATNGYSYLYRNA
jgi:1-aminocyclopropane-1-carboxylate deaminase